VNYDLANYSYNLTSQVFSDVYVEEPSRQAAFVEDRITLGDALIAFGLRYDRFETGAARVDGMPRISTNPALDPSDPEALMTLDEAHSALSPRVQMGYRASPTTDLRVGIGRQVQMPDFGIALAGITTDISVTSSDHVFATDLGYASTTLAEIGVIHRFSDRTSFDVSVYGKQLSGQVATRLETVFDPLLGRNVEIRRFRSDGDGDVLGAEVRMEQRIGPYFRGFVGYAYQDAQGEDQLVVDWSRPHTLAGAFGAELPDGWGTGSVLGSILENSGVWGTFRFASGTAYTACLASAANIDVVSGQSCPGGIAGEINGQRLPATKQFDLKLARSFPLGGTRVTGYLDARNLFNFDNTTSVFAMTGQIDSPELEAQTWQGDSAAYANEADWNGARSFTDGSINLHFAGTGGSGCGTWATPGNNPAAPNCVYLVRAEQRFGDGDGIFNLAEQQRASSALYHALNGNQLRSGPGRFIRLGIAVEL
jgi:TonB dependent receptor-like, beta-barrel